LTPASDNRCRSQGSSAGRQKRKPVLSYKPGATKLKISVTQGKLRSPTPRHARVLPAADRLWCLAAAHFEVRLGLAMLLPAAVLSLFLTGALRRNN
jgi:hypothetical protein